jgi:hypothetical protein
VGGEGSAERVVLRRVMQRCTRSTTISRAICDCGKPAGVRQSRHEDTAATAYYCRNDYRVRLSLY